jgi:uncharacterized protein
MEQRVTFPCRNLELEGLWAALSPTSAVIITHPHPRYGGDMHNPVVETISKAYRNNGWSTLRFNFRGTGSSEGRFDNGIGEQEDLAAAIAFLKDKGICDIELAGYSFGAWVLALYARRRSDLFMPMRFVAPPVAFVDFEPVQPMDGLQQVILGQWDELAPVSRCETMAAQWNPKADISVIDQADHFFWNQMDRLQMILESNLPDKNN